ncbi:DUF192 domain-containing protein [Rhizobium leguminosarum]|uniref:DUF192 domain-containing protein n=1 Tax=Rhizobium leguminosarum TaxID=384 RepID=UPI002E141053|nr:DUF192 domain-containing protein [Rhizobium leguminosarum]
MFRLLFVSAFAFTSILGFALVTNSDLAYPQTELVRVELKVQTDGGLVRLHPEVASTPLEQQVGMMGRLDLKDADAMLFPRQRPEKASFWMKNTPSSLDLVFIAPDMTVESIRFAAEPFSETPIPSRGAVIAVLEVPAGLVSKLGIHSGDRVDSAALGASVK